MQTDQVRPERIHAIDAIRGFCLLLIFFNHITIGYLHGFSPVHIMFSDAAEVFIFLAGVSCFLAYGPNMGERFASSNTRKIWRRAKLLYFVNWLIALTSVAILLVAEALAPAPKPELLPSHLIDTYGSATYLWHVLTMQETVGYSVVLRVYVALMLIAPFYVWLGSKRYWYPMIPAGLIWLVAGHFELVASNSLSGVPLALTILPWGLIFAFGISFGAARKQGVTLRKSKVLVVLAAIVVLSGPICATILARISPEVLSWTDTRNDYFWTGASKTLQSPLRVAYMLALVYLVAVLQRAPLIRLFHESTAQSMLSRLGRNSLEVFAAGAVMALAADHFLWFLFSNGIVQQNSGPAILIETGILVAGICAMVRIAETETMRFSAIGPIVKRFLIREKLRKV